MEVPYWASVRSPASFLTTSCLTAVQHCNNVLFCCRPSLACFAHLRIHTHKYQSSGLLFCRAHLFSPTLLDKRTLVFFLSGQRQRTRGGCKGSSSTARRKQRGETKEAGTDRRARGSVHPSTHSEATGVGAMWTALGRCAAVRHAGRRISSCTSTESSGCAVIAVHQMTCFTFCVCHPHISPLAK